jgi:hypothetical protein
MPPATIFHPWNNRLREPSISVLLVLETVVIFFIGPLMAAGLLGPWGFDVCLLLMALVSVSIAHKRYTRLLIVLGFIGMLIGSVWKATAGNNTVPVLTSALPSLFFIAVITIVVARTVFSAGPITVHRIQGAIVIYLNIALIFGLIGSMILVIAPDAYSGASLLNNHLNDMIYFSMTTLTTTGYGDFLPVTPLARSLANLEAVIGQLYPATLMATLVGLHVSHRQQHNEIT